MSKVVSEARVESELTRLVVKKHKGLSIKLPAHLYRGIPDRLILLPGGRMWFLELKKKGGRMGVHQDKFREILEGLGFTCLKIEGMMELEQWRDQNEL